MERGYRWSNLMTLFGVEQMPGVDQIRNIVEGIAAERLSKTFDTAPMVAREQGVLEEYRVLNGTIPVALDGVWCFSSTEVHCERCLRMEKKKRKGKKVSRSRLKLTHKEPKNEKCDAIQRGVQAQACGGHGRREI
jgi:hypothetical protein